MKLKVLIYQLIKKKLYRAVLGTKMDSSCDTQSNRQANVMYNSIVNREIYFANKNVISEMWTRAKDDIPTE